MRHVAASMIEKFRRWLVRKLMTEKERKAVYWRDDPDILHVVYRQHVSQGIGMVGIALTELEVVIHEAGVGLFRLRPNDTLALGCRKADGRITVEIQFPVRH